MSIFSHAARGLQRLSGLLLCCSALLLPLHAVAVALDRIVAVVDEDVILQSELSAAVTNIMRQYAGKESQLPPANVLERQVLDRLVINRLQMQRADAANVRVTDTEVDQTVARIAANNNMSVGQLKGAIEKDGLAFVDFRKNVVEELTLQRMRERLVSSRVEVSETEVDLALAQNRVLQGEIRLATILVAMTDSSDLQQLETARKKIEGVAKLVSGGEMEFSAAAIRYSDAPNAIETAGDLGWRRYDQIPPAFAETVVGMKEGDVSQPIRGQSGFYLLKLTDKRETQNIMVSEYNARHIVIDVTELVDDAEARTEVESLRKQLIDGADFGKLAQEFSDDTQSAKLGGDLGWFQIDTFGTTYAETVSALKAQEISAPFRTERGWHIVQRLGERQQDRTEDMVRGQAREAIRTRKTEEAYEAFIRQLRNEAFVDNRLEGTT